MKIFFYNCLPDGLEFGSVVAAKSEYDAKVKIRETIIKDGWDVSIEDIELTEIDIVNHNDAIIIDPFNPENSNI